MARKIAVKPISKSIVEYLFSLIIVLQCNTIWTSYEDTLLNKALKVIVVLIVLAYFVACGNVARSTIEKILVFGVIAAGYFLIYALVVSYRVSSFLYFVLYAVCIYAFTRIAIKNKRDVCVLYAFENVVLIISIIALFFWFFGSILGLIHPTNYVYSNWTGNDSLKTVPAYYNLYFETQSLDGIIRNTSIFTEAPMYNFVLCIALLVDLFFRPKLSKVKYAILLLSILTTMSTTGYCMAIIAILGKYIFNKNISSKGKFLRAIIIPLGVIVGIVIVRYLLLDKLSTSSGSTRVDDFAAGFKAWKTHIFFGAGFNNSDYIKQFMSDFRSNNLGFSNSPMQILAHGGIYLVVPYIYFSYKWIRTSIRKRDMNRFLFFACFAILFTITVTSYRFLTLFIFMAYDFGINRETERVSKKENSINPISNEMRLEGQT